MLSLWLSCLCAVVSASNYQFHTIAKGLDHPWSMAFLPNGDYLVSLRAGQLIQLSTQGDMQIIDNTPETYVAGQGGFFDVLLDPNYARNKTLYLAFAHGSSTRNATRVIKAQLVDGRLQNVTPIFTASYKDTAYHFGGRLAILNDGTLLITSGDGSEYREAALDTFSLLGKVARIHTDGSVPADNPFADGQQGHPAVYAYGIRNPQGLVYDAAHNVVYENEHGPKGGDEVNVIRAGANYGWPATSYGVNYSGAKVSPYTSLPGIDEPITVWTPSIAPSGMTLYTGEAFPEWQGDLFVGALVDQDVKRLDLNSGKVVAQQSLFSELGERIRDVRTGPDGALYLLTDSSNGKVIRVTP